MGTENQQEFSVPFDFEGNFEGNFEGAEAQIEVAKAELAEEAGLSLEGGEPGMPPELEGILAKYGNDPVKLATAYRAMQQEFTRLRQQGGQPPAPADGEQQPAVEPGQQPPADQGQGQQLQATITPEKVAELQSTLFDAAGNEARYHAVGAWAKNNLSPERLGAYNAAIASGDVASATVHFKAMQYDFTRAQGYPGRLVGGRAPASDVKGFSSEGEMMAAMSDPRYNPQSPQFDRNFHGEVIKKMAASSI
jgi:hypothetical protein